MKFDQQLSIALQSTFLRLFGLLSKNQICPQGNDSASGLTIQYTQQINSFELVLLLPLLWGESYELQLCQT